jgi:hypothetical protein
MAAIQKNHDNQFVFSFFLSVSLSLSLISFYSMKSYYYYYNTLKGQIDDATGSHTGGGRRVDVVPCRVRIDPDSTARQHDEILHGQLGETVDVHFGTVHWFRAKEHRVDI